MTKKEIQGQETRYRIIRSAAGLFTRFGYCRTTVSEIARLAGVTTGAVFHHFPTKEKLLMAVIEWLSRGIRTYVELLEGVDHPSSETISRVLDLMCEHYERYPEATICLAMLATELSGSNHPAEQTIKSVYEIFVRAMASALAKHSNVTNSRAAAISFVGAVQGIAIQGLMREKETNIRTLAKGFYSMLQSW